MPPKKDPSARESLTHEIKGFNWANYFAENGYKSCVQVSSFPHAPFADKWNQSVKQDMQVEVANDSDDTLWIASVLRKLGYYLHLKYLGSIFQGQDFFLPVFDSKIHPLGFCDLNSKSLRPPPHIRGYNKSDVWPLILSEHRERSDQRSLPEDFSLHLKRSMKCRLKRRMKLEVVDKDRPSTVRVASVIQRKSGRMRIRYEAIDNTPASEIWCHETSPLIHPVGWAQLIGHRLIASDQYAEESFLKAIDGSFDEDEASWKLFPPVQRIHPATNKSIASFAPGMKLEAIHPFRPSSICVATIAQILRCDFMMISIDGVDSQDDWFCCHPTSPYIFPAGFCDENDIALSTPANYKRKFNWTDYLEATESTAAPIHVFHREPVNHRMKKNSLLEAVDLTEPELIRVASVTSSIGRLLRIHFTGFDEKFDQWMDCESPDLYPVGWCAMNDFPLQPPLDHECSKSKPGRSFDSTFKESSSQSPEKRRKINLSPAGEPFSSKSDSFVAATSASCSRLNDKDDLPVESTPLPRNPVTWTVNDVRNFLVANNFSNVTQHFLNNKIDGRKLLELTYDELAALSGCKVGPALKINALIQSLSGTPK